MTTATIKSITKTYRTISGAEWPVEDVLQRVALPNTRVRWVVLRGLCNGVPESSESYGTKRAACRALGLPETR